MDKNIEHRESIFEPRPGVCLFEQWWEPSGPVKAFVIIVHGLAEHSSRYAHVADYLCSHGYAVGAFDLEGHGRSEGKRGLIGNFDNLLDDLQFFLQRAAAKAGDRAVFLLGHSLGTGIVLKFLIDRDLQGIRGAVLSGTMLMAGESIPPILIKMVYVLDSLAPGLPLLQLESGAVSRDPAVVKHYETDPLNFRGKLTTRTGAQINRTFQYLQDNLSRIDLPLLILQGSEDRLVNPAGSRLLYEQASSQDKTFKVYEGLYHEILNEPEKEQVMADIVAWMEMRLPGSAA